MFPNDLSNHRIIFHVGHLQSKFNKCSTSNWYDILGSIDFLLVNDYIHMTEAENIFWVNPNI